MTTKHTTVDAYLKSLPTDRRDAISAVRKVILDNLDSDYEEGIQYGMIGYYVPHRVYPKGYHCDPKQGVTFMALASQKQYMSLYLMCYYGDETYRTWFETEWKKTGKKLNMGKSCIRFKKLEDLPLDVIAKAVKKVPAKKYIKAYEAALKASAQKK